MPDLGYGVPECPRHGYALCDCDTAPIPRKRRHLREGEPCAHPGCLHHRSHPCDGCGRIAGRSPSPTPQEEKP